MRRRHNGSVDHEATAVVPELPRHARGAGCGCAQVRYRRPRVGVVLAVVGVLLAIAIRRRHDEVQPCPFDAIMFLLEMGPMGLQWFRSNCSLTKTRGLGSVSGWYSKIR